MSMTAIKMTLISLTTITVLFIPCVKQSKVVRISETFEAHLISKKYRFYKLFPDNETLSFFGFSFESLPEADLSSLSQLSPSEPIPSFTRGSCDDFDYQTSLKCQLLQDDDDLLDNIHLLGKFVGALNLCVLLLSFVPVCNVGVDSLHRITVF